MRPFPFCLETHKQLLRSSDDPSLSFSWFAVEHWYLTYPSKSQAVSMPNHGEINRVEMPRCGWCGKKKKPQKWIHFHQRAMMNHLREPWSVGDGWWMCKEIMAQPICLINLSLPSKQKGRERRAVDAIMQQLESDDARRKWKEINRAKEFCD